MQPAYCVYGNKYEYEQRKVSLKVCVLKAYAINSSKYKIAQPEIQYIKTYNICNIHCVLKTYVVSNLFHVTAKYNKNNVQNNFDIGLAMWVFIR